MTAVLERALAFVYVELVIKIELRTLQHVAAVLWIDHSTFAVVDSVVVARFLAELDEIITEFENEVRDVRSFVLHRGSDIELIVGRPDQLVVPVGLATVFSDPVPVLGLRWHGLFLHICIGICTAKINQVKRHGASKPALVNGKNVKEDRKKIDETTRHHAMTREMKEEEEPHGAASGPWVREKE